MININSKLLREVIYTSKVALVIDELELESIFESCDINTKGLSDLVANGSNQNDTLNEINKVADEYEEQQESITNLHLCINSSSLKLLLTTDVIIPTNTRSDDVISLYRVNISINQNLTARSIQNAKFILAGITELTTNEYLLIDGFYQEVISRTDLFKCELIETYTIKGKKLAFGNSVNNIESLSLSSLSNYRESTLSILTNTHTDSKGNNYPLKEMKYLQLMTIHQILKYKLFCIFEPLLRHYFIRIRTERFLLSNSHGELFFKFSIGDVRKGELSNIIKYLIPFGIYVLNINNLGFSFHEDLMSQMMTEDQAANKSTPKLEPNPSLDKNALGFNPYNYILFRLLGTDLSDLLIEMDQQFSDMSEEELLKILDKKV